MLAIARLSKAFGGVPALCDVALDLRAGEVHALMGENGAGKSTLIRVLAGVERPDRLEGTLDGAPLDPGTLARAGLRVVHQEAHVVPALSVAETVFLGRPLPRRWGLAVDWPRLHAQAQAALARFGITGIDPRGRTGRLGPGDRTLVRLASVLAEGEPRAVILDEPTAALGARESERLFDVLRDLRARGCAILYVSHRLHEVVALADRVTVLRDGAVALACPMAATSREGIVRAMTGRAVEGAARRAPSVRRGVAVSLRGVAAGRLRLDLDLREGEVLGVAGLEGAGQSDLLHLLLGDGPRAAGPARLLGGPLPRSPREAWRRGVAFVPRERRAQALMEGRGVTANTVLAHLGGLSSWGLARPAHERAATARLAAALSIKARSLSQPVRALSGGNQQKVVLARAALAAPRVLLLDEPTRGVDVGARADVHAAVGRLAEGGAAVVLASTDLPELLALSDRILVLRAGRQAALADARGLDAAGLLGLIQGAGQVAA